MTSPSNCVDTCIYVSARGHLTEPYFTYIGRHKHCHTLSYLSICQLLSASLAKGCGTFLFYLPSDKMEMQTMYCYFLGWDMFQEKQFFLAADG